MTPTQLKARLQNTFTEALIEVLDQTGTQDHYEVRLVCKSFEGLSRIQQKQKVMQVVDAELKSGEIHAFSILVSVPQP